LLLNAETTSVSVENGRLSAHRRTLCARSRIPSLERTRFSLRSDSPYACLMTTGILLALWMTLNDNGREMLDQGKPVEAAMQFHDAAIDAERTLGHDHPATAMVLRNLALAYSGEGLYRKSEAAALESLRILEVSFGKNDDALVPTLNVLGEALIGQHRLTEAGRVLKRAVAIDAPGPHGATALHNLGALYQMEGNLPAAKALYKEALARRVALLGADHPVCAATREAIAGLQGRRRNTAVAASSIKP